MIKKRFISTYLCALLLAMAMQAQRPVPSENQLRWQNMEMYAFIHYSLNTYTDQEWASAMKIPSCLTLRILTVGSGRVSVNRQVCVASSSPPSIIAGFACGPRLIRTIP